MEKNFNISRYKELLKLEKEESVETVATELTPLFLELVSYRASVESQISYNRKNDYFILIQEYLRRIISPYEFRSKFLQMTKENTKKSALILENFKKLEVFTLAKDLEDFANLTDEIAVLCLEYDVIWDETVERMSESEFYSLVNKHYLQLKKIFSFENID